jgi:hypothetical protein
MAVGRTLQHHFLKHGPAHRTDAFSRIAWRPVVLICIAIIAAALASHSLLVDPPDSPRAPISYLP